MQKAKLKVMQPFLFNGICVQARGLHKHFKLRELFKAIKEKKRYDRQTTKCFCPKCDNELCGSKSHLETYILEYFKCSKCGEVSRWDFDYPVPLLIK